MIFLKIASVLLLILSFIISITVVKLFRLQKKGYNFADIAFPLLAFEFYLISDKAYYHSLLPQLVLALSLLALAIVYYFLMKKRLFSYQRFFKFFWRAGFILTFFMYLALIIALFTIKS
ncbi:DUF3397 domain-containing protein [Streptococcus acidominimus]|uniref:DUF3397 domain-containing protein n=1 Tax=Streptococcus acidominimus TaxID=1326 RepID=A0A1Q8EEI6_STRAI|nr:DUF3397 domain-containing protein [Streptococcus acidominimus]MBF0846401.1 DUF3397 domain-containing protein [Streptococcus danieliae]MBF0819769.1 DUF3397 domain-containing protein [Streptococcus acidominimus]MBF0839250.1 DUF3397 domain-containing protein [Streptococcus acidominimus]OLF50196.1 hypothetical protein BU200_03365 [Streptococcus acidominimus]TFU29471.1 DUF3397 domain-containing protein [Streptococcus acidominimus]